MAGTNPITQALIELLRMRQDEEALAQRKTESEEERKFRLDQLNEAVRQNEAENAISRSNAALNAAKIRQEIADEARKQIAGGLRKSQGYTTISDRIAPYFRSNLPPGHVPYDISDEDLATPQSRFQPFSEQIVETEIGPVLLNDVVSFPEFQEQKFKALRDEIGLDVLKSSLVTQAQEAARRPNIQAQIAGREGVAQISANQRENTAAANRISQENIALWRNAAMLEAARIRRTATTDADKASAEDLADSAYLATIGKVDLVGSSNAVLKQRGLIRSMGRIPFGAKDKANLDLDRTARSILEDVNGLSQKLSSTGGGVLTTGLKSLIPGTDLYNSIKNLQGRAARVAEIYGERGRKSEGDIMRALGTMMSAWITRKQAQTNLGKLQRDFDNNLLNVSLRGMPDEQRIENLLLSDFDPTLIMVQSGNQLLRKYKKVGDTWHVYSPQDKGYVEVTSGR